MKASIAAVALFLALPLSSFAAPAPAEEMMTSVRFDVVAVNKAFDLLPMKTSRGVFAYACGYLGEKAKTGMEVHRRLGKDWEEISMQFQARGEGFVQVNFQGEWYMPTRPSDVRHVWMDNVRIEGADVPNGDLEEFDKDGKPAGWICGNVLPRLVSRDGSIAKSGKSCVGVWIGGTLAQKFPVKKDGVYTVRAWFRVADPSKFPQRPEVKGEYTFGTYSQKVQVTFKSPEAAAKASLKITPLFEGCKWHMGSRWDDNNPGDILMRDVLAKHGQHGTYYLNAFVRGWENLTPTNIDSKFGRDLLITGDSVGCHSLTHPMLSYCNRNRIFEETAGCRILWEAGIDKPVLSYSFSYCNYINAQDGLAVQADIHRALLRGGFMNCANEGTFNDVKSDITLSPILPGDGADIDAAVDAALENPEFQAQHPSLAHSMHMYYDTPAKWAKFEAQLDKYGRKSEWWYANQNKYGAYRFQLAKTKLTKPVANGKTLTLTIERPLLIDVNDDQALTFEVAGVPRDQVESVACDTAQCKPAERMNEAYLFNLWQDRSQSLPKKIGLVPPNYKNRSEIGADDYDNDFADLKGLLHFADGQLKLTLQNKGKADLTDVRVTYRLPLAWKEGVVQKPLANVAAGKETQDTLKPTRLHSDYKYNSGYSFFVAQVDFKLGGEQGRLHLGCDALNPEIDRSYPSDGFIILGPLGTEQLDREKFVKDVQAGKVATQDWLLSDETKLTWTNNDPLQPPFLDVELVHAGKWFGKPATHVLATTIKSDKAQEVELRMWKHPSMRIILGDKDVTGQTVVQLPAGQTRLLIVTEDGGHTFLRVLKPGTEERVTNIQFLRPRIEGGKEPYRPTPGVPAARRTLAGKWRAVIVTPLPPAAEMRSALKDPGISEKARKFVAADADASKWQEVDAPSDWDKYGGDWPKVDGEAVFQRVVEVPAEWAGKDLMLSFGPVDDLDDTFFNGVAVGKTDEKTPSAWQIARRYRVPGKLVKAGKNVLSVRIFDNYGSGGFTGAATEMFVSLDSGK